MPKASTAESADGDRGIVLHSQFQLKPKTEYERIPRGGIKSGVGDKLQGRRQRKRRRQGEAVVGLDECLVADSSSGTWIRPGDADCRSVLRPAEGALKRNAARGERTYWRHGGLTDTRTEESDQVSA